MLMFLWICWNDSSLKPFWSDFIKTILYFVDIKAIGTNNCLTFALHFNVVN